jgi:hypothetical protein
VAAHTPARKEKLHRRGLLLEWFTVAWNVVEAVVAIGVGLVVGSVTLVGFGVDSGIEVISAVALLWRLYRAGPNASAEEHGEGERKAVAKLQPRCYTVDTINGYYKGGRHLRQGDQDQGARAVLPVGALLP